MNNSSFYFKWKHFAMGLLLGFIGVIIALFAREERRDKIYSSILGFCLGFVASLLLMKYVVLPA